MFPKIPVPPHRRPNQQSGYGALDSARSSTKAVSNIDALFPPIGGGGGGGGGGVGSSARTQSNSNYAKEPMSRKSMRLLQDIKDAAKTLVDDVMGPEDQDNLISTKTSARRGGVLQRDYTGNYNHPFPTHQQQQQQQQPPPSFPRRTVSSGPKKATVGPSSYLLQQQQQQQQQTPSVASKAVLNSTRKTASGGDMGTVSGSTSVNNMNSSLLLAEAAAASTLQQVQQPSSARRPEPITQRLERLEQKLMQIESVSTGSSRQEQHHALTGRAAAAAQQQQSSLGVTSRATRGMSPNSALRDLGHLLVPHEVEELKKVRHVYFAGTPELAMRRGKHSSPHTFDNEHGDYKIIIGDHIAFRYEVLQLLGAGSFAQVVKVMDHKHNAHIALKIIKNKKKFTEQAQIERNLLDFINKNCGDSSCGGGTDYANVFVRMRDSFVFRGHVVMAFDLHGHNLYDRLKATNFASTPIALIQSYASQLLRALHFLRHNRLIHCDLKPENVLLKSNTNNGSVRLADFGSSTFDTKQVHTYICSRFYRCPTIVLGLLPYTCSIDSWSLGCVLFELFTGTPLFPAQSEMELLGMISARLGPCPASMLDRASRRKHFYDPSTGALKKTRAAYARMHPIRQLFPPGRCASSFAQEQLGDLISRLVVWDPDQRLTPAEALQHPFITKQIHSNVPKPPTSSRRKL